MNRRAGFASQRWREMVEAEHAQSQRAMGQSSPPDDFWEPLAEAFRADPGRTDDPLVQRLFRHVEPHHTLIDVGAGGGRLALPLSLGCRHVVAVEPSASMGAVLQEEARRAHRDNVTLLQSTWEEAEVAPADLVLCVQVLYTVKEIEAFVRKMEAHARERVLVVMEMEPPQFQYHPFWRLVHGEERLRLPCLPEFMELLWGLGIYPDLEMLPPLEYRSFESREVALRRLRHRLFLAPGSDMDRLLEEALSELLEEVDGSFRIRGAPSFRPGSGLVSWRPAR